MNTPNPLMPQGSLPQAAKGKSTVRIAVFTIVAIHAVFFAGLLMQGCKRNTGDSAASNTLTNTTADPTPGSPEAARLDNSYASLQDTNTTAGSLSGLAPTNTTTTPVAPDAGFGGGLAAQSPMTFPATENPVTPPAIPAAGGETREYTVVKGDSFARIAKAHGTTVAKIQELNPNVSSRNLKVKQKILVPVGGSSGATSGAVVTEAAPTSDGSAAPRATTTTGSVHKVKAGETLTRIARQHGVTVKALKSANNLKTDRVVVGQNLKIPAAARASAVGSPTPTTNAEPAVR